jgi:class 3 adenylate cyclase/tetratricopeptide (TPR) repeat protein
MGEREELQEAIGKVEGQRAILGDAVVETALRSLREKLERLDLESQPGGASFPGTLKQVTVLFADLVDSTAISQKMDPEEFREVMNAYFSCTAAEVEKHGGTVGKFIGDAILATFGMPAASEHDPENAVKAGLGMVRSVEALGRKLGAQKGIKLAVRVGVNTGIVYASSGSEDYLSVAGYVVNVASRLQSAAPHGGVLISKDTYRHVRGVFDIAEREPLAVKGVSELVPVYLVEGEKPRAFRLSPRGVEGIEAPMVGRDVELSRLQVIFSEVVEHRACRIAVVVGDAGVGKSRLLYEFTNWLELRPEIVKFFRGRTDSPFGLAPYALVRDFLSFRFEIGNDDVQQAREKLENGILSVLGPEGREKAHIIGQLTGFDFSASPYLNGILQDSKQIRDRAFHYMAQFFSAISQDVPAVALFLEDVHWADDGSMDLIRYIAHECSSAPILIVCNTRPSLFEKRPSWVNDLPGCDRVDLAPLPDPDCQRLVLEILRKVPSAPAELIDLIVRQAEGYPFYLEEFIKTLIEEEVIVKGPDRWEVPPGKLSGLRVPPTLQGVLQARLDSLPRRERETLQVAAIVGRVFWDGAVARIERNLRRGGPDAGPQVRANLDVLRERELVFERSTSSFSGAREFTFKHALLHEVAYESVLRQVRQQYHAQVAQWLSEESGGRVDLYAGMIAEHLEKAAMPREAAGWFERAGRLAKEAHSPASAIGYYQRAISSLAPEPSPEDAEKKVVLLDELGEVLILQAKYPESAAVFKEMMVAARSAGLAEAQAKALNGLSWAQDRLGDYPGSLVSAREARAVAQANGARLELVRALFREGWAQFRLGVAKEVLVTGDTCLALARELGVKRETALSLKLLGIGHILAGRHQQAATYQEEAFGIFRSLKDRWGMANMLNNLGENARMRGDYETAEAIYAREMEILREIGNKDGEIVCLNNIGGTKVGLGRFQEAQADLLRAMELSQCQSSFVFPETLRFLAEAKLGLGRVEEAIGDARRALELALGGGDYDVAGAAWRILGMAASLVGKPISPDGKPLSAAECFARSLETLSSFDAEAERARTLREWGKHEVARGDRKKGEAFLTEARSIFAKLNMPLEAERVGSLQGEEGTGGD